MLRRQVVPYRNYLGAESPGQKFSHYDRRLMVRYNTQIWTSFFCRVRNFGLSIHFFLLELIHGSDQVLLNTEAEIPRILLPLSVWN